MCEVLQLRELRNYELKQAVNRSKSPRYDCPEDAELNREHYKTDNQPYSKASITE